MVHGKCGCLLPHGADGRLHKAPLNQVGPEGVADFLAIRKSIGYAVPDNQPLYNTETYAGYKLGKSGK